MELIFIEFFFFLDETSTSIAFMPETSRSFVGNKQRLLIDAANFLFRYRIIGQKKPVS